MSSATPPEQGANPAEPSAPPASHLRPVRLKGSVLAWACAGIVIGAVGLLLITGLSGTPWLFLLYPVLIGVLLVSLGALALHLLHRF